MAFQDWDIPQKKVYHWRKGSAIPADLSFTVKIRDIIGEPEAVGYTDFEIKAQSYAPQWLFLYGDYNSGSYYPITATGVTGTMTLHLGSYINTFNLEDKTGNIIFTITGKPTSGPNAGQRVILHSRILTVYIKVYSPTQTILLPEKLTFNHEAQSLAPDFQSISVDAIGSWEIFLEGYADRYDANALTGTVSVVDFDFYGSTFKKITGTNSGTFEIRPSQTYLNTLAPNTQPYTGIISAGYDPGEFNRYTALEIFISESTEVSVNPESLFFHAIKTVSEADAQTIIIDSGFDFTLDYPTWALVSPNMGTTGTNEILVDVVPSSSIDAGNYQGVITVTYNNGNGTQTFEIPITYLVDGFITLPYSQTEFNFTLDNKMVEFFSDLDNTFFDVLMNVKAFDFFTGVSKDFIIPFKIVLLRNRQRENIGKKIHNVMSRMLGVELLQNKQYKTCEVDLTVKERDIDTREVQREFTLEKVKFIAGMKPVLSNGMGILSIYDKPTRVTPTSRQIINLLVKSGNYTVVILKNNQTVISYNINGNDYNVYKDEINFESYAAKKGDVFEYRLYTSVTDFVTKKYFVFPPALNELRIFWEDEYKLLSSLQFTGEFILKSEFESKSFKRYRDLVEILENLQTNKESKLTLNTGHILKTEDVSLESLLRSKRAWLYKSETEIIELVPQTKSLINIDSNRELNAFDIEFIINRKSNEEVYSF